MPAKDIPSSDESPLTRRQKFRLVGLVILKRLRFIAILAGVGLFIGYWDTVKNYWDKWIQPGSVAVRELEPGQEFFCPMDPQVVRTTYDRNGDVPHCPICGMSLSIRKKGEAAKLPPGITGRVQLSPDRVQMAGVKTVPVELRPMAKQTQLVGFVTFDESRLSKIVSRVDGYVEKLYVDKTFTEVRKGDKLAEIYSPELYSTARELALAARGKGVDDYAATARKKLLLLGMEQQDIDAIAISGGDLTRLVVRSPQEGFVVDKKIVAGSSIEAKQTLFEVADLSTVWVEADVYEKDIPFLRIGQQVEAAVEAFPGRAFTGKLALIYPRVDAATRTNRIRFQLDNPGHELHPGMFATVRVNTPLESIEPFKAMNQHEFLAVPQQAVVDTGSRKVVYIQREPGLFEGVEVELGPRYGDDYPVIRGLEAGDLVAAAGSFLIDAETRLNPAAASSYFGASGGPQSAERQNAPVLPDANKGKTLKDNKAAPSKLSVAVVEPTAEDLKNIEQLPEADRKLAIAQRVCPITGAVLGSMGVPVKITLRDQPIYLCCSGCVAKAQENPDETLKKIADAAATFSAKLR
jgi:membrane fusion protein, copper/silver efflux system